MTYTRNAALALLALTILRPVSVRLQTLNPSFGLSAPLGPFRQLAPKLVGSGAVGMSEQGYSVAISADGNTALVGGDGDFSGSVGAAWVWNRSGVWTQQGPKLQGAGAEGQTAQGFSVALSADGDTALVGGVNDFSARGAVWVWTRSGGVWTQQGPKLVGSCQQVSSSCGHSVSLSVDGNTALIGGPGDNFGTGAVWAWTRTNGVWTEQSKLVGSCTTADLCGWSVALSADGNTALLGGPGSFNDEHPPGGAWVWTRTNGVWTQQGAKLVGSGSPDGAKQGWSVALSADGDTAIVGGIRDNDDKGAAWVWTRSGGVWTQQGSKLVGSAAVGNANQGTAVSLSADGNVALVGGSSDNSNRGATWVWTRNNNVWTQLNDKVVGVNNPVGASYQGRSVSLSADGHTAIVGGYADNNYIGAAWIFGPRTSLLDFDGDGKTDRTVFRPSDGTWYSANSGGGATATGWGVSGDVDVPGDYDGDGKTDIAVFRPSTALWYIVQSSDGTVRIVSWGASGDVPLAGDVDGDGKADLVIWRPSTGVWFVNTSSGGTTVLGWGMTGDQPLLADFDHDGKLDLTVFRSSTGVWYIPLSSGGASFVGWGTSGDIAVPGDFDGDGAADFAVFRPTTGQWFVSMSWNGTSAFTWGMPGDVPVSGDWDGDGASDYTVWRPSSGIWFTQFSLHCCGAAAGWGINGDKPSGRAAGT